MRRPERGTRSRTRERPAPDAATQKLQKTLAQAGVGSRRQMEEWIREGRVTVNGVTAQLGSRVGRNDNIQVDGHAVAAEGATRPRVLIYHKPEGEIVSRDDPEGRASVFDSLPPLRGAKWLAVGRLDFNTGGLLVLTTSGELANRLMHPRYEFQREYAVRVRGRISDEQMAKLSAGIPLSDGLARCEMIEDQGGEGANRWYRIVMGEGRNRIVRRMFDALGITVSRLMRTRFGSIVLSPRVTRGRYAELPPDEVRQLLVAVGVAQSASQPPRKRARPPGKKPRTRFKHRNKR